MKLLDEMFVLESGDGQTEVAASPSVQTPEAWQTVLRLNGSYPIYAVHFPGNPITPGVCLVQVIGELLQRQTGRTLALKKIVNLKFVHTLTPTEATLLTVGFASVTTDGDTVHAKGTISVGGQVATKFSLIWHTS